MYRCWRSYRVGFHARKVKDWRVSTGVSGSNTESAATIRVGLSSVDHCFVLLQGPRPRELAKNTETPKKKSWIRDEENQPGGEEKVRESGKISSDTDSGVGGSHTELKAEKKERQALRLLALFGTVS